jgi:CHASE2 domain-containing sensor protein
MNDLAKQPKGVRQSPPLPPMEGLTGTDELAKLRPRSIWVYVLATLFLACLVVCIWGMFTKPKFHLLCLLGASVFAGAFGAVLGYSKGAVK